MSYLKTNATPGTILDSTTGSGHAMHNTIISLMINGAIFTTYFQSGNDLSSLNWINFENAIMQEANMSNTNMSQGVNFKNSHLGFSNFSTAQLNNADFTGAFLSDINFTNANLSGANLSGANLSNSDFTGADLTGVLISDDTDFHNITHAFPNEIILDPLSGLNPKNLPTGRQIIVDNGVKKLVFTWPTDITLSHLSFFENINAGQEIATITSLDRNSINMNYEFGAGGLDNDAFSIFGDKLYINDAPNYEVKNSYQIKIKVTDEEGNYFEKDFTLAVGDQSPERKLTNNLWRQIQLNTNPNTGSLYEIHQFVQDLNILDGNNGALSTPVNFTELTPGTIGNLTSGFNGIVFRSSIEMVSDLQYSDLKYIDFSGIRSSTAGIGPSNFTDMIMSHSDFTGSNLENAYLSGSNFSNCNFRDTNLKGIVTAWPYWNGDVSSQVNFTGADFRGADLFGSNLSGADLSGAIFDTTFSWWARDIIDIHPQDLQHGDGSLRNMSSFLPRNIPKPHFAYQDEKILYGGISNLFLVANSSLLSGDLIESLSIENSDKFVEAGLGATNFQYTLLQQDDHAYFTVTSNGEVRLSSFDSNGKTSYTIKVNVTNNESWDIEQQISISVIEDNNAGGNDPAENDSGANDPGSNDPILPNTSFTNDDFSGMNLSVMNGSNSTFLGVSFNGSNLSGTDFSNASFTNCSFVGADLTDILMQDVYLSNVDFSGANLNLKAPRHLDATVYSVQLGSNNVNNLPYGYIFNNAEIYFDPIGTVAENSLDVHAALQTLKEGSKASMKTNILNVVSKLHSTSNYSIKSNSERRVVFKEIIAEGLDIVKAEGSKEFSIDKTEFFAIMDIPILVKQKMESNGSQDVRIIAKSENLTEVSAVFDETTNGNFHCDLKEIGDNVLIDFFGAKTRFERISSSDILGTIEIQGSVPGSFVGGNTINSFFSPTLKVGDWELPLYFGSIGGGTINNPSSGDICFPAGTPVETDQGLIAIEKLSNENTIDGVNIVNVVSVYNECDYLVKINKHALGPNYPKKTTLISRNHRVFIDKKGEKMIPALALYNGKTVTVVQREEHETIYNVLLPTYSKMKINGLVVETLHPKSIYARK